MPLAASERIVAFLAGSLDDEYETELLRGAVLGAREEGATVLCVAGGSISDADPNRRSRNFVFDLVNRQNTAGALVVASVLAGVVGAKGLRSWLEKFRGLPLCCVGAPVEDQRCLQVDNPGGVHKAVLHLTREHRARRLAFLRGPRGSVEAELRLRAFEQAVTSEGLELDQRCILDGDFSRESGASAIATLLDERHVSAGSLDGIVAANDYMALGALHELSRRGIAVPDEIALIGFDDIESARLARPPLTTVRQPTELLGRRAARLLGDLFAQRPSTQEPLLATELVVRSSCGCSASSATLELPSAGGASFGAGASFIQRRQIILASLARAAGGRLGGAGSGWDARLLDALVTDIRTGERRALNRALEHVMERCQSAALDGELMQELIGALRAQALPCVAGDATARDRLEAVLHDARAFAALFGHELSKSRQRQLIEHLTSFEQTMRSVMFGSPEEVSRAAAASLPAFGVEACVVAGLNQPGDVSAGARVQFGFGPQGRIARREPVALAALTSHELVARSGRTLIMMPVVLRARALGVALFSVLSIDGDFLEEAADAFGPALASSKPVAG